MANNKSPNGPRVPSYLVEEGGKYFNRDARDTSAIREDSLSLSLYNLADELTELLISKHKDYGPKNISDAPGGALNGLRVRMHDKLARINNLVDSGASPEHESLEDSFKDMANYAIIGLLVLRDECDK